MYKINILGEEKWTLKRQNYVYKRKQLIKQFERDKEDKKKRNRIEDSYRFFWKNKNIR